MFKSLRFSISRTKGEANIEPQTSAHQGRGPQYARNAPNIHGSYRIYYDLRLAESTTTSKLTCNAVFSVH